MRGGNEYSEGGNDKPTSFGCAGFDTTSTGGGNDSLDGGVGRDWLIGGAGKNTFLFGTKLDAANVGRVYDFAHGTDTVALSHSVFQSLGTGMLPADAFHTLTSLTAGAETASDHILYYSDTGALFYDPDGAGGVAPIQVATLTVTRSSIRSTS